MTTWSAIEVIWTVVNLLGILGNGLLLAVGKRKRLAIVTRGELPHAPTAPRLVTADRYLHNRQGRFLCHLIGAGVGLLAMALPEGDPLLAFVAAWGMVGIVLILLAGAGYDLVIEQKLDRLLAADQELGRGDFRA